MSGVLVRRVYIVGFVVVALVAALLTPVKAQERLEVPDGFVVGEVNRTVEGGLPDGRPQAAVAAAGEVEALRTARSSTRLLGDGSFLTEMSPTAVHYEAEDGRLRPVPRELSQTARGWRADYGRDGTVEVPASLASGPVRTELGEGSGSS